MDQYPNTSELPVHQIERFISEMPSLPATAARVLELCNDLRTSPNDLNRVITLDPVLTGQVLKLVNSAYFSFNKQVITIPRAIIILGMNTIKNLVLSTAVLNTLASAPSINALFMEQFWFHSVCTGVTAKQIAIIMDIPESEREQYFVGGLLHDLGKIPLVHMFPVEYNEIIKAGATAHVPSHTAETSALGMNHARAGSIISKKWRLGEFMTDCLEFHHDPQSSDPKTCVTVQIIALANLFSNFFGTFHKSGAFLERSNVCNIFESQGLPPRTMEYLETNVVQEIKKARAFLHLTVKS